MIVLWLLFVGVNVPRFVDDVLDLTLMVFRDFVAMLFLSRVMVITVVPVADTVVIQRLNKGLMLEIVMRVVLFKAMTHIELILLVMAMVALTMSNAMERLL